MKRKITYKELEQIISFLDKKKIERDNNSWGDCRVHYNEFISSDSLLHYVKEYMEGRHTKMNELQIVNLVIKHTKSF